MTLVTMIVIVVNTIIAITTPLNYYEYHYFSL